MSFGPRYGETPISTDELDALLAPIRRLLPDPVAKAEVYDLEQAIHEDTTAALLLAVLRGDVVLDDLLTDHFGRDLHRRLYGAIWRWAGRFRRREFNIGVAPEQIAVELRGSLGTIRHRWRHTDDWTRRTGGGSTHAETVRIRPFVDGNGRTTRLLADVVFAAAQEVDEPDLYNRDFDKPRDNDVAPRLRPSPRPAGTRRLHQRQTAG